VSDSAGVYLDLAADSLGYGGLPRYTPHMANVRGLGGAFIYSEDAPRLADWYRDVLGIEMQPQSQGAGFYRVFETRDVETSVVRANPVFAIHAAAEELATSGRGFVINLRVDDLRAYLEQLRDRGVESEPIVDDSHGLFSAITDPDGNRLELYEEPS
jgi:catechol 2,3-dioxygenase-like lactoylglutathione lyase family enzyme